VEIRKILAVLVIVTLGLGASHGAFAQGKPRDPLVEVSLVSEYLEVRPGETFWIAMHQDIYPGWHTYWTNAGDSGEPPSLKWRLRGGLEVGALLFPPPERVPFMDLMNFGYSDEVILPMQVTVPRDAEIGSRLVLEADAQWLVCEDICIPEEGSVSLILRIGPTNVVDEIWSSIIKDGVGKLPTASPWEVIYEVSDSKISLFLKAPDFAAVFKSGTVQEAAFFPHNQGLIQHAEEQTFVASKDGIRLSVGRGYDAGDLEEVTGLLVFTQDLADGSLTNSFSFVGRKGVVGNVGGGSLSFLQAILFAFLGGIILNIMPCVFPVLFLKALAFVGKAGKEAKEVRAQGFSYTAGVVLSFALLGGALLGLRAGGEAIGWGFQLQTPGIVGALAFLLFTVGLSLSGVFTVGGSIAGVGQGLTEKQGHWGSFFTGVLAAVVATPCTAPFMGAAMGFALTQSAFVSLLVFIFLGFGMALPFLILSLFPDLAKKLPKPGAWMERVKQFLAFPMFGAAAWLTWVFGLQTQQTALLALLIGFVFLGFAAWAFETSRMAKAPWPTIGKSVAGATLVSVIVLLTQIETPQNGTARTGEANAGISNGLAYEAYSEKRVQDLVAEGKPVFVNFTAAWCISCLANERVVFSRREVRDAFEARGVTYLKGDWTNRDPEITKALAAFDRAGVPLYLYYSGEPGVEPQVLPQILTPRIMLDALGD
jgi:thiol:disulfide interchange protein/DsbC/DsbD-like thiol-disulfide interchange protein